MAVARRPSPLDLPGEQLAKAHGYTCMLRSAGRAGGAIMAKYVREPGICLHVERDDNGKLTAKVSYTWKLLTVSTDWLTLPNKNFALFQAQVVEAAARLGDA